jgi:hypothetical protein
VDDARMAWHETTSRGAISVEEPHFLPDENGDVVVSSIRTFGDTIHTFIGEYLDYYPGPGDLVATGSSCAVIPRRRACQESDSANARERFWEPFPLDESTGKIGAIAAFAKITIPVKLQGPELIRTQSLNCNLNQHNDTYCFETDTIQEQGAMKAWPEGEMCVERKDADRMDTSDFFDSSDPLVKAFALAAEWHRNQTRKNSGAPYICHLMQVSGLILEYGGTKEQAIAGLLHDVLEDCGRSYQQQIRDCFGESVTRMVLDCSDGFAGEKTALAWRERKEQHLKLLAKAGADSLFVYCADKVHNGRTILDGLWNEGLTVFERFKGRKNGTLWYYGEMSKLLSARLTDIDGARMARELARILDAIESKVLELDSLV